MIESIIAGLFVAVCILWIGLGCLCLYLSIKFLLELTLCGYSRSIYIEELLYVTITGIGGIVVLIGGIKLLAAIIF